MSCYERLDLVAEHERIDEAVRRASQEFAATYAIVAMPKAMVGPFVSDLNRLAMDVDVVDDGEDDGIPSVVVVVRSSAADGYAAWCRRQVRLGVVWFAITAVCALVLSAAGSDVLLVSLALGMLVAMGLMLHGAYRRLETVRKAQQIARSKGL